MFFLRLAADLYVGGALILAYQMGRQAPFAGNSQRSSSGEADQDQDQVVVLQGPRSGEKLRCVVASFSAPRSVIASIQLAVARHLPEGKLKCGMKEWSNE
jgi:hypothetical protein